MSSSIDRIVAEMVAVRHHLHRNPELSFVEWESSAYIKSILEREGISFECVAETGVLAVVEGAEEGSDRLIRADIDALPICEDTGLEYASTNGAMHACGHDIHTAVLLGTLIWLSSNRDKFSGRVIGLFQPGEECSPGGASIVLASGALNSFDIKEAYALHTAHDMPVGCFGARSGEYMASTSEMRITVKGDGGHAALTNGDSSSITLTAEIIMALREIEKRYSDSVVAIGRVEANGTTNVIPLTVSLEGTVRAMSVKKREDIINDIYKCVEAISPDANISFTHGYPPIINNPELSDKSIAKLKNKFGEESVIPLAIRMTSDDFGLISEIYPSFYFRLGVKEGDGVAPMPHTAKFVASDGAIVWGVLALSELIVNY